MISADNISVHFGAFVLLNEVSLQLNPGDRIGLVGRNGAGKTTLMKIMSGKQQPSSGTIVKAKDTEVGYLPQQMTHMEGKTVFNEAMTAFDEIRKMEKEIEEINRQLESRDDYESAEYMSLIEKSGLLHEKYELHGGNAIHGEIIKTLRGLGFNDSDMERPTSEFSGGWRMRIELAKILLRRPEYILLDEPTNHLDIESIQWLEEYLSVYPGGVMIISHDRAFLDKVTNRTVEVTLGRLVDYRVSFSKYEQLRKERREQEIAAWQNQQKMIKDTEDFIQRFRYKATKAVQVQSRIKQLDKLDRIEVEEEDNTVMNVRFPSAPRSGRMVVEGKSITKRYGDHIVLQDVDIEIERGEKIAFVGKNGEGKTTLSRIINGELDCFGNMNIGQNVSIGYFAQNQDTLLDENKTVFETIDSVAVGYVRTKIRDILGAFLFSGEEVDKKVRVLSGGERSRLSLAKLLLQTHNLLLMDEPTNHMDMRSKDILKKALRDYDGTLIVVSHDREFLDGLVDKVYEFKNRKIKQFSGGIYDFLRKKKMDSLRELEKKNETTNSSGSREVTSSKQEYEDKKETDKVQRKYERKLSAIESDIEELEKEDERITTLMVDPDKARDPEIFARYEEIRKKLERRMKEWEKIQTEYEEWKDRRK